VWHRRELNINFELENLNRADLGDLKEEEEEKIISLVETPCIHRQVYS
jgi:hypothetical protein